jgi:PAS domain S-box-containing protein
MGGIEMDEQHKKKNIGRLARESKHQPDDHKEGLKRKTSERMRQESQKRFQALVETISDFIWETNADGIYTYCSPQVEELWGYKPEELIGSSAFSCISPERRESYLNMFRALLENPSPMKRMEATGFLDKTGKIVTLEVSAVPFFDDNGKLLGYRGTSRDITQKKLVENALRESEEKYRLLVENASEVIAVVQDGVIKFINKRGLASTGYSPEDMVNKPFQEFVQPDDRESVGEMYRKLVGDQQEFSNFEFQFISKDCRTRWAILNAVRIIWEEKPAFLAIITDVSDRKVAQEALKSSEEKYRMVVENASEAISITQDGIVKYFNPKLLKSTGYSAQEIKSIPFLDFIHPDDRKLVAERYQRRIRGEVVPISYEYRVTGKDGSTRWMVTNAALITWEGRPATLNFFTDITEEKKLRDQLTEYAHRITQVQEEEKKRIAYELHDDTAQYLAILKMQIGALAMSEKIQSPEVKEKLEYLEKDADRAFHDVRRYSHELRPVVLEHMGLRAALEQIAEDFNNLNYFTVELIVEGREPGLSEEVKLGYFRIAQEALNNVRKHSKAGKAIIDLKFQKKSLSMKVTDDGIGFNLQETRAKSGKKGSLGLISMQERADLIGGRLKIESQTGRGTTIRVEMPLPNQSEDLKKP